VTESVSFTHLVLLGALVSAGAGIVVLAIMRVVTRRRPGGFEVLEAVAVSGAVAMVQFLMVEEGFSKLHVAYLWMFVTLPVIGAVVLAASLVPTLRPSRWGAIGAGGLLSLALLGLYATYIEPRWIRTERVALDVAPLEGADELRVGVLADLQTGDIGPYEYDAVGRLMAEEPDLILIPGDIFQSDGLDFQANLPELRALLSRLEAPGGVFITEGDVDSPERMAFMSDGLDNLQWLDEEVATTEVRGVTVHIGGISVRFREAPAQATIDELAQIDDGDLRILLSHRPDAAFHVPDGGADLVVAGHTHGGQVAIPFIGPPITMSNVPRAVAAGGLHEIDGIPIYLSNGVGLERATAPQVRFNSRPSVGLVTLT